MVVTFKLGDTFYRIDWPVDEDMPDLLVLPDGEAFTALVWEGRRFLLSGLTATSEEVKEAQRVAYALPVDAPSPSARKCELRTEAWAADGVVYLREPVACSSVVSVDLYDGPEVSEYNWADTTVQRAQHVARVRAGKLATRWRGLTYDEARAEYDAMGEDEEKITHLGVGVTRAPVAGFSSFPVYLRAGRWWRSHPTDSDGSDVEYVGRVREIRKSVR